MFALRWLLVNLAIGTVVLSAIVSHAAPAEASGWCRYRGQENCSVLGSGSGGVRPIQADEDPDMGGHEGVPPNSQGSGTRATQDKIDYWRLINGGKGREPKSTVSDVIRSLFRGSGR